MLSVEQSQIIQLVASSILFYVCLRFTLDGIAQVSLRERDIKARIRGQSAKEWFCFSNFRDVIPSWMFPVYYGIVLINLLFIIAVVISVILWDNYEETWKLVKGLERFNYIWFGINIIILCNPKNGAQWRFDRYLPKTMRKRKKRK